MVNTRVNIFRSFFAAMLLFAADHFHAQTLTLTASKDSMSVGDVLLIELNGELDNFSSYATLPAASEFATVYHEESFNYSASHKKATIYQAFEMKALSAGDHTIGPAWIQAGTRRIYSNALRVHVSPSTATQEKGIVFLRCEPDKETVYAGEKINVAVRLYVEEGYYVSGNFPKAESYSGFWKDHSLDYSFDDGYYSTEYDSVLTINGKKFNRRTLITEKLYPNATGDLLLPKYVYTCFISKKDEDVYAYDSYNMSFDLFSEQKLITVLALPDYDSLKGFTGDVGHFFIKAGLMQDSTRAWEPVPYTLWVSGDGNFQFMMAPKLSLPDGLRAQNTYNADTSYWNGNEMVDAKMFRYLLTAEKEGDYDLSGVTYTYFDTQKKNYVTLPADSFRLHVAPGQPIQGDSVSHLPDSFLTAREKDNTALLISICAALIGIPVIGFILVRRRKKKKAQEAEEKARIAAIATEVEYVPPPDTSLDQARALIHGAGQYLHSGMVLQSVNNLYEAMIVRICGLTKMRREEISVNTLGYQLRLAHREEPFISEFIAHYEDLKLKRYSLTPSDTAAAHVLIVQTAHLIELSA